MARRGTQTKINTAAGAVCPTGEGIVSTAGGRKPPVAAAQRHESGPGIDMAGIIGKAIMDQLPEGFVDDVMEMAGDVKEGAMALGEELVERLTKPAAAGQTYDEMGPMQHRTDWQAFDREMDKAFAPATAAPEPAAGAVPADQGYVSSLQQQNLDRLRGMSNDALDILEDRLGGELGRTGSGKAMLQALQAERQRRLQ